jgi:acyl-CoA thioester hydrolase
VTGITETFQLRIYYEDTDHGGVVYYANYLKFMERARSEFLRSAGLELDAIEDEYGVMFAVTEAHVFYHAPALFNDLLAVESSLVEMRGVRIAFRQCIYRQSDRTLLTEGNIRLACINGDGKVRRIPPPVANKLRNYLNLKE